MVSIFEGCGDSCGWTAALVAALAYGSYGVPIKETKKIDVHPLVLQTYKTVTMFGLSWFVLAMGVQPSWTSWGLVSGILWVVGGTTGIYAIRKVGMALAVGTWASVMIAVNFFWGILVFREPVSDIWSTIGAFLLLALGLVGMSYYSSPEAAVAAEEEKSHSSDTDTHLLEGDDHVDPNDVGASSDYTSSISEERIAIDPEAASEFVRMGTAVAPSVDSVDRVTVWGVSFTARKAGLAAAVFNGLLSGSTLIPVHYAIEHGYGGANFMISFASGALIANGLCWVVFFGFLWTRQPRIADVDQNATTLVESKLWRTWQKMPPILFRQIWIPGFAAGILLTIAWFGSILATTYLGQGVGNSLVQSKILISGLWGIFWYKEIAGCRTVSKWLVAAAITVTGIIWLSYERIMAANGHRMLFEEMSLSSSFAEIMPGLME